MNISDSIGSQFMRFAAIVSAWWWCAAPTFAQSYNANMPEAFEDPGSSKIRAPDASFGVETIDPFTGALKIVVTDLVIPSNGGLDLSVVRNYQSFQGTVSLVPARNYQKGRTATGIGWDLHYGRLWRGSTASGSAAPQLAATDVANGCRGIPNVTSKDNPVLELPDGSRKLFAASNSGETNFAFVSADRWILRCLPTAQNTFGDGGAIVISPEGIKYTFNFLHRVSNALISGDVEQATSNLAFHVTRIEKPNGTSMSITYLSKTSSYYASLNTVTHSEGHSISFTYDNPLNQLTAHLSRFQQNLSFSQGGNRIWILNYVAATAPADSEYLESVVGPDGRRTSYQYITKASVNSPNPDGAFSLKQITTSLGGILNYYYVQKQFPVRDSYNIQSYYVVTRKEIRRRVGGPIDGTWTYNYRPATGAATSDFIDISGPTGCVTYEHEAAPVSGKKWRIGLLVSKKIANPSGALTCGTPLRSEVYTWVDSMIADQDYFRPPGLSDSATFAPRMASSEIELDGGSARKYRTDFNSPDSFGNPTQVVETGVEPLASNGNATAASRTTNKTYFTDTTAWIINRGKNETVLGASPTYATPTSTPVTTDYAVARTYFTSGARIGMVQRETRAAVSTDYDYYTSGTNLGELSKVTDANGVATGTADDYMTTYSNYKRGTARSASRSIDGTTTNLQTNTSEVNDTGTVAWEQDAEGKRTSYSYNEVNLLESIATARVDDTDVTISRSSGLNTDDTITRGAYREVRQYDGFGAVLRTDWTDTTPGTLVQPLFQKTDYDADGRVFKTYAPNSTTSFIRTDYDALNRPTKITQADGKFTTFDYLADNRVVVTDERGFQTTRYFRSYGDPSRAELMRIKAEYGDAPGSGVFQVTHVDRNKLGQVLSVTQDTVQRTFRYNTNFFLYEENHPEVGAVRYTFDLIGNVLSRKVVSTSTSQTTNFMLDRLYRPDLITYVDTTDNVDFDYYKNDRLKFISKGGTRWDYLYDENDNFRQEKLTLSTPAFPVAKSYQVDYTYDGHDARATIAYPSGLKLDYVPDVFGRPTRINATQGGVGTTGFASAISFYPGGQLHAVTFPNGLTTTYGQDARLRPTTFVASGTINSVLTSLVNRTYQYDDSDNVKKILDNLTGSNTKTLTYDGLSRLRTASGAWGSGAMTYDLVNNIKTKTAGSESLTLDYGTDGKNRLKAVSGSSALTFGYDVYGNITSTGRVTFGDFQYDDDSLLRVVKNANGTVRINYSYDGNRAQTMEKYLDGWSTRYRAHSMLGSLLYEEDIVNFIAKDFVYLNGRLIATRAKCTSSQDTDSDGINDCSEFRMGLNKTSAADASMDTDGDGLSNFMEFQAGTDIYKTDTDGDTLSDGYEENNGLNAVVSDSNSDTDGDGLTNLQEFQLGTNPADTDTDNDGILDGADPNPRFNPATLVPILQILLGD